MTDERRTYAVPTERLPSLSLSAHVDDLAHIAAFLNNRGIETRATRIDRYGKYLEQVRAVGLERADASKIFKTSEGGPFQSAIDWLLYVLREVHELMWIVVGLKRHVPAGVDGKLKALVSGRDFAALDVDSASRNTQFELRIASYFCQAGCEVDLSTETDIIAITRAQAFYVECKRVARVGQLGKRLSEGRAQLERRLPRKDGNHLVLGCIAVDVTKLAFARNGLTFGMTNDHSRDVVQDKLVGVAAAAERLLTFHSPRKLLCYWLQVHIASMIMRPVATPATRFSSLHIARPGLTSKEARVLKVFYDAFESVSKSDQRSSPSKRFSPRASVTFPAGSTFSVNADQILRLLEQAPLSEDDQASTVATLNIGGQEYAFTFFDLAMLPSDVIAAWKNANADDRAAAGVSLVAELYLQRLPYEERQEGEE